MNPSGTPSVSVLTTPRVLAERWLLAFNARDLDALLSLYAEGAVHHSPKLLARRPETGGRIEGKAELRAWWADAFARLLSLRYEPISLTADSEAAVLEYWRKAEGEPDLRVAEHFRCAGGCIVESRVFHG